MQQQNIQTFRSGNSYFIYDGDLIDDISDGSLFEHKNDYPADGNNNKLAQGRGQAKYFNYKNLSLVFKHYQRGGFVAKFLHDRYLGISIENTRAFLEWRLLAKMQKLGLPVPVPVAARVLRSGLFYKADMVMQEIENSTTLADLCLAAEVAERDWVNVGRCIRKFHYNNIYHGDLNARNILLRGKEEVFLIDFDKSCVRTMSETWKMSNLSRLQRSLIKIQKMHAGFNYTESNWDQLLEGYRG